MNEISRAGLVVIELVQRFAKNSRYIGINIVNVFAKCL